MATSLHRANNRVNSNFCLSSERIVFQASGACFGFRKSCRNKENTGIPSKLSISLQKAVSLLKFFFYERTPAQIFPLPQYFMTVLVEKEELQRNVFRRQPKSIYLHNVVREKCFYVFSAFLMLEQSARAKWYSGNRKQSRKPNEQRALEMRINAEAEAQRRNKA